MNWRVSKSGILNKPQNIWAQIVALTNCFPDGNKIHAEILGRTCVKSFSLK